MGCLDLYRYMVQCSPGIIYKVKWIRGMRKREARGLPFSFGGGKRALPVLRLALARAEKLCRLPLLLTLVLV